MNSKRTTKNSARGSVKTATRKTTAKAKPARAPAVEEPTASGSTRSRSLVIVESPTKARTLSRYLGAPFVVMASGGHVRDLPERDLGVNIERGFDPQYQPLPGKKRIVDALKSAAAGARRVLLATDPDREGEAIAWHIAYLIGGDKRNDIRRVQFHEITKRAVEEAIASPGSIDISKVEAQQARRIMDRLVGYQVSPLLWRAVTKGLSAGRVQSVALRLICEREAEIVAFVTQEYWTIDGKFAGREVAPFVARLVKYSGKKVELSDEKSVKEAISRLIGRSYSIADIKRTTKRRQPPPPYITSTLQQDAARRLGYTVKRTMSIAQKLYEGMTVGDRGQVGLITYMRTDSTRVSPEANAMARAFIAENYGEDSVAPFVRTYKNKNSAVQDAHEAIRPTDVRLTPEIVKTHLSPEEFKLYDLIWKRFIATQMKEAVYNVTTVSITDGVDSEFRATGQVIVQSGFLILSEPKATNRSARGKAGETDEKGEDAEAETLTDLPPNLSVGMPLDLLGLDPAQHFTEPPPRFSEASLVKELDEQGIGRPSTYATIISTLLDRTYIEKREKLLHPTELGQTVNRILVDRFPDLFSVKFTAKMEEELDKIEEGAAWRTVLSDFYEPFKVALEAAQGMVRDLKKVSVQEVGRSCPDCGKALLYRFGKKGRFISCSGYPDCKYAENLQNEGQPAAPVETSEKCPKCGKPMLRRTGRFGPFLGCSGYPSCKTILPLTTPHSCIEPDCTGNVVERRSKTGKIFFSCSRYPDCKFISWDPPADGPCAKCGAPSLFKKTTRAGESVYCKRCHPDKKSAK